MSILISYYIIFGVLCASLAALEDHVSEKQFSYKRFFFRAVFFPHTIYCFVKMYFELSDNCDDYRCGNYNCHICDCRLKKKDYNHD
jgi:hypothetical protein